MIFSLYLKGSNKETLSHPFLFILAADVLSRSLNTLNEKEDFIPFSMNKLGPQINQLAYVDDIVILISGKSHTVKMIMK